MLALIFIGLYPKSLADAEKEIETTPLGYSLGLSLSSNLEISSNFEISILKIPIVLIRARHCIFQTSLVVPVPPVTRLSQSNKA
jgi:hypothetical protein